MSTIGNIMIYGDGSNVRKQVPQYYYDYIISTSSYVRIWSKEFISEPDIHIKNPPLPDDHPHWTLYTDLFQEEFYG